ncbi:MAG: serine/threonine protein kinase [Planctomycetia bacterium]|nr:serine/threonine protein kinase [Planctomycetia bacterium]
MNNSPSTEDERQREVTRLIRAVVAFKSAWQAAVKGSAPPRLETFLSAVPEAEPAACLRELLSIELGFRANQGEVPRLAEYQQRFPDNAETIQAVFAERGLDSARERSVQQVAAVARDKPSASRDRPSEVRDRPFDAARSEKPFEPERSAAPLSGNFSLSMGGGIEGLDELDAPAAPPAPVSQALAPGTVLGNYKILGLISQGAMGVIYKAEHRRMGRTVAIKMISPSALRDAEAVQRFHRETQAMARLEHPNIVTAHDADQVGDIHILVMQYVDGDDLWTTVKRNGPLPLDMAVRCLVQTAQGMEYAHQAGIVHRDIKPSNLVMARNGVVKILDLGLARLESSLMEDASFNPNLTQAGNIMGTVDFMAPEQALDAKEADQRADIYSLGCTFYFLLTGRTLFAGDTMMKRMMAHRFEAVPSLRADRQDVPELLDSVFQKMIAKEASDRYQSVTEVLADLAPLMAPSPSNREIDLSASDRRKFSANLSLQQPSASQIAKSPGVRQPPPNVAAEPTARNTQMDTQVKPASADRPVSAVREAAVVLRGPAETASRKRRRLLGAAAVLGLLVCGLLMTLSIVIYLATDNGTFIIEAADQEVTDALHGTGLRISDVKRGRPLTLQPGRHTLKTGEYVIDVAELPPRIEISTTKFQIKRGGRAKLKVTAATPSRPAE